MIPTMTDHKTDHNELEFHGDCPTCEQHTMFHYIGIQTFPTAVAEQLGLPAEIHLWSCDSCHSTISHIDLGIDL